MFGYNVTGDFLLPILKESPEIRELLVAELQKLPVDRKVLRYPGGTCSRTWQFNDADLALWIQFCLDGGVEKQSFVWNISDHTGSFNALKELRKHQNVTVVEVSNEENYWQRATGFWAPLINSNNFFAERYYRPKGQQYGKVFNLVKNKCANQGYNGPVAAVFGVPNALPHKWWNKGVEDTATHLTDVVIHCYRKFSDDNFMDQFTPAMEELRDYMWWFTELNMDYEDGRYYDKRFGPEHKTKLIEYLNWVWLQPNTMAINIHSFWKNNGFGRFMYWDHLIDNYEGWFNNL